MDKYSFCELAGSEDIKSHEYLLYDSFVNRAKHGWIYQHYHIQNKRMRAPFPYGKQLIFGIKHKKELLASVAVNLNSKEKMQLEYIGFSGNKIDKNRKFAEILTLCATGKHDFPNTLDIVRRFNQYLIEKYTEHGLKDIYGTTFIRKKLLYCRLGFEIIDRIENKYGTNLLLRQRID